MNVDMSTFGKKNWSYVSVVRGPVTGPQPRLAQGSGRTGAPTGGTGGNLPSYVSDNDYQPSPFAYAPTGSDTFMLRVPRSIATGSNGRELVGSYNPHDSTPGQRWNHQMRSAHPWQQQEYPPSFRNLVEWQQVMKYRVGSVTRSARPLPKANYFLGYQLNPEMSAKFGQNALGYMGNQ